MLLWSGIARYIALNPRYRYLFGAVSISASYSDQARQLMMRYLQRHAWHSDLASLVAPRHPFTADADPAADAAEIPDAPSSLDRAVAALDDTGAGMPVLLRQYLKLNARAFAYSIDPAFGGVLDAMVLVDRPAGRDDRAREPHEHGAGVDRSAGHEVGDPEECVAVPPGRPLARPAALVGDLPAAVEAEVALDPGVAGDAREALETVVGILEEADRGAFERDRPRMSARAGADPVGLEDGRPDAATHELPGGCEPGEETLVAHQRILAQLEKRSERILAAEKGREGR
jgi:hypothetical protein